MITMNMTTKREVRITDKHFSLENNILTLTINIGDYDITGKQITAVLEPKGIETAPLATSTDAEGVTTVSLPIYSSYISEGVNYIQLYFRWDTTKLEQSGKMMWVVERSLVADDPGVEQQDLMSYYLQQITLAIAEADRVVDEAGDIRVELDESTASATAINNTLADPATGTIKLATDAEDSLQATIDASKIGILANLTTTEKGTLVGAINEVDSELTAHKADVATQINTLATLPKGLVNDGITNNLQAIQTALNVGGHILINKAGTYLIDGTLLIGSNTTFELGEGVIIKQKTGQNLLKNNDIVNGNVNITIKGGTWDYNLTINGGSADNKQLHSIVLQKVDGLQIIDVKVVDTPKYAFLIADCTNISIYNVDFDTESDGLHFMGPINNVDVRNVKGRTGDNMVAFTIGDYSHYELSRGNMTNITISGVYCKDSAEPIRLVGNPDYYFDNIVIEKVYGTVTTGRVVAIIQDTDLTYTDVRNIVIKDIHCKAIGNEQIILYPKNAENITIENVTSGDAMASVVRITADANIKNLTLNNIEAPQSSTNNSILIAGIVKNLYLNNINVNMASTSTQSVINIISGGSVTNIYANKIYQNYGSSLLTVGGALVKAFINQFNVENVSTLLTCGYSGVYSINLSDGYCQYVTRFLSTAGSGTSRIRLLINNVTCHNDTSTRIYLTGSHTVSINGSSFKITDIANLTPNNGDMIYNTNASFGTGIGLYIYESSAWRKL